jgi:hypothetical protein
MSSVVSYQDLLVWQKAMKYVEICYALTENFPSKENVGLSFSVTAGLSFSPF